MMSLAEMHAVDRGWADASRTPFSFSDLAKGQILDDPYLALHADEILAACPDELLFNCSFRYWRDSEKPVSVSGKFLPEALYWPNIVEWLDRYKLKLESAPDRSFLILSASAQREIHP